MTIGEVKDAIRNNNTTRADEILNEFCPPNEDGPLYLTSTGSSVASIILKTAAAQAYYDALDDSLAYTIIERLGTAISIFPFLRRIVVPEEVDKHLAEIPVKILTALHQDEYSDEAASEIKDLRDNTVFKAILACIVSKEEIEYLDYRFKVPLIREIYARKIVPAHLIFSSMSKNLRNPTNDIFDLIEAVINTGVLPDIILGVPSKPSPSDKTKADNQTGESSDPE